MIELKDLAGLIETGIVAENGGIPYLESGGVKYLFLVTADTGEFAEPYREGNEFFSHIQGNLISVGSSVQTTSLDGVNAKLNALFEILVPVTDEQTAQGSTELPDAVRKLLDGYFAKNQVFTMKDSGDVEYLVAAQYSLANSGVRAIRPDVGDSYTFTAAVSYNVIQQGARSDWVKLSLWRHPVSYDRIGIRRTTAIDPATPSNSNSTNKNVAQSNALVINVSGAMFMNDSQRIMMNYLTDGEQLQIPVSLSYPFYNTTTETAIVSEKIYNMIINDFSLGAEGSLPISFSAQFVEVLE